MMKRNTLTLLILCTLSALLLSLPWLLPHAGALSLVGFIPLLMADDMATCTGQKKFWIWHFYTFVLWNAVTTFWVCNATLGGGIFAILANAFQMSLVWELFRFAKRRLSGSLPYIFLMVAWIAWERQYFHAQISWPWLTLGNAFARSTASVQWYEYTGTLGGSLWVWLSNLGIFGLIRSLSDGSWASWTRTARICSAIGVTLVLAGPLVLSRVIYSNYEQQSEASLEVIIAQPNFDPYHKFEYLSQAEQTDRLIALFESELAKDSLSEKPVLLLAPETFTSDVVLNDIESSPTLRRFRALMRRYPRAEMLFGASTYEFVNTRTSPSPLARKRGDSWMLSHNSAIMADAGVKAEVFHKSKLVVATELTPFPKIVVPLDNWLSGLMGVSGLMGRCVGQDEVSTLTFGEDLPLGCAVCYESVYGEYCTDYVRRGAKAMTVITNDAWWGNTPGYRQHLSYSCLRAIELRRDIARCGNTGISAFINQKGEIVSSGPWWEEAVLRGEVNLNSKETFFVRNGDLVGRISTLVFLLMAALLVVRLLMRNRS